MIKKICNFVMHEPAIIKIILIIIFLYQSGLLTGIICFVSKHDKELSKNIPDIYLGITSNERFRQIRNYIYQKHLKATKIKKYTPELYFQDLIDINAKIKEIKTAYPSNMIIRLQMDSQKLYSNQFDYSRDMEKAKKKYLPIIDKIRGKKKNEKVKINYSALFSWAFMKYLLMMPISFLYFLIITNEERGWKKFSIKSPLSFLLAIIFYPIVCLNLLAMWFKEAVTEAQYRRLKRNVFSTLSKDEIAYIKNISKRIPLWKLSGYLEVNHYDFKRGFTVAFMAVIIIGIMPRGVESCIKSNNINQKISVNKSIDNHLARMEIDGKNYKKESFVPLLFLPIKEFNLFINKIFCFINELVIHLLSVDSKINKKIPILAF